MNRGLRIILAMLLVLVLLFCTIAIVGVFNLGADETVNVGRLIIVIVGELIAVSGLVWLWRGRRAAAGPASSPPVSEKPLD